nr:hypothetical protein [Staphylococcus aureus]
MMWLANTMLAKPKFYILKGENF